MTWEHCSPGAGLLGAFHRMDSLNANWMSSLVLGLQQPQSGLNSCLWPLGTSLP